MEEEVGEEEKLKEEEKKKGEDVQSSDVSGVDEKREEKREKIPEDCDQNLKRCQEVSHMIIPVYTALY